MFFLSPAQQINDKSLILKLVIIFLIGGEESGMWLTLPSVEPPCISKLPKHASVILPTFTLHRKKKTSTTRVCNFVWIKENQTGICLVCWKFTAETICLIIWRCCSGKESWRCFVRSLIKTISLARVSLFSVVFVLTIYLNIQLNNYLFVNRSLSNHNFRVLLGTISHIFRVWISSYWTLSHGRGVDTRFICGNGGSRYASCVCRG